MSNPNDILIEEAARFKPIYNATSQPPHQPGLHALIIGISQHAHLPFPGQEPTKAQQRFGLGLQQLTCAATTGFRVYKWLLDHRDDLALPLLTVRLLLAATTEELASVEGLRDVASDARRESVLRAAWAWRANAALRATDQTLFYFVGHGFQRKRGGQVLILEDIGEGIGGGRLSNAIEASDLVNGMAPHGEYSNIATQQLFIFDACRLPLTEGYQWEEEKCTEIWSVPVAASDKRTMVEYHTTEPGEAAFAIRQEQTAFSKALLACLEGGGAEQVSGRWCVTVDSLSRGLRHQVAKVAESEHAELQKFQVKHVGENATLIYLDEPPEVPVDVRIRPEDAAGSTELTINDLKAIPQKFGPPVEPHPLLINLKAGSYLVTAYRNGTTYQQLDSLVPPSGSWKVDAPTLTFQK